MIASLEARYREQTAVASLRIKHNGVLGYFIEATPQHGDKLQTAEHRQTFRHRQTIGSAVRFTTDELATLATRISQAADQALAMERELFDATGAGHDGSKRTRSRKSRDALARLDVATALAELAADAPSMRGPIVDAQPRVSKSSAGAIRWWKRRLQSNKRSRFVPNDCDLSPDSKGRLWLVTGPNMAGKSTFLRQNALIAILAQMGAFVPAESAHIGIVDKLFSPRRRGGRSGARALHLHGRDGGDRGHPQSGDGKKPRHPR